MLNLSLVAISRGEGHGQWEIPQDHALWDGVEIALVEPVRVEVDARMIGEGGVLVRGRIRAAAAVECRRCLRPVTAAVDEAVDLLFEPLAAEEEEELAGEVYPLPARGDDLDLSEAIREQLLLHLPGFALCDDACRGLCPQCGADLNQAACACVPEREPSPWDALKNIKFE
jgi:uncharacterized protein